MLILNSLKLLLTFQLLGYCSSKLVLITMLLQNQVEDGGIPLLPRFSDGLSLQDKLDKWSHPPAPNKLNPQLNTDVPSSIGEMCEPSYKEEVMGGLVRGLNYYESHVHLLDMLDAVVGLEVLEGVVRDVGLNGSINLGMRRTTPLLEKILQQTMKKNGQEDEVPGFLAPRTHLFGPTTPPFKAWKSWDRLAKVKGNYPVGNDPETIWGEINGPCQIALGDKCEVPHVCRKLFLDPEPQSQYMLSHQALYVYMGIQRSCQLQHPKVFKEWEGLMDGYCAKMLGEAEFIAAHNYPDWGRDIFAEYVFICGLAGYPNFLRSDWIREILSWQSSSDYGCFLNPEISKYYGTELIFPRYPTASEKSVGIEETGESCLTHLSSVSLAALAVKLRWIHENC